MSKTSNPTCCFCGKAVTDDSYCYGCEHYVCEDCDHRDPGAMGSHPFEDHEGEEEAEGLDTDEW